jgi:cytochrome bd ubiquinol oxidase subunit I
VRNSHGVRSGFSIASPVWLPHHAILTGWYTAEVGRQPWVVYGLLRTKDAVTPSLRTGEVLVSFASYILVYATFVSFGVYYIYKLLQQGPTVEAKPIPGATGSRPLAYADSKETATGAGLRIGG